MISYGRQWIDSEDEQAVLEALRSPFLTQGPKVAEFETALCRVTGAKFCVAVSNGTAALHIAVAALDLPDGSEGITSPNTFTATASCMAYCDVIPCFADIDPTTYNIDPHEIERKLTQKTRLLIPVHFAGQTADMKVIGAIARKNSLRVIEDASHAIGSLDAEGNAVGSCLYSHLTTFSFHPVKTITTGEGGAVTTNDPALYQKLLYLRSHGITRDAKLLKKNPGPWYYEMHELGFNYRMTDIQAALGVSQLKKLEKFAQRRRQIVDRYNLAFKGLANVIIPFETSGVRSCFHLYVVRFDFKKMGVTRSVVMEKLRTQGIETQVHYIPVPTQPWYQRQFGYKTGDFPEAEAYYEEALSLPLYPAMSDADVDLVVNSVSQLILDQK